jgi:hypothetical protein
MKGRSRERSGKLEARKSDGEKKAARRRRAGSITWDREFLGWLKEGAAAKAEPAKAKARRTH